MRTRDCFQLVPLPLGRPKLRISSSIFKRIASWDLSDERHILCNDETYALLGLASAQGRMAYAVGWGVGRGVELERWQMVRFCPELRFASPDLVPR